MRLLSAAEGPEAVCYCNMRRPRPSRPICRRTDIAPPRRCLGRRRRELALRHVSRTVPIVFAQNIDPVGAGIVQSLSRPGTNATGFNQFEYSLSAKWLELLREIAPGLKRAGVLRDQDGSVGIGQWAVIQAAAGPIGLELTPIDPRDIREMEALCACHTKTLSERSTKQIAQHFCGATFPFVMAQRTFVVGLPVNFCIQTFDNFLSVQEAYQPGGDIGTSMTKVPSTVTAFGRSTSA